MTKTTAKTRLIANAENAYNEIMKSSKVCDQMNASVLSGVINQLKELNELQAHKLENAICLAEDSSKKSSAKHGWPWKPVSPINYMAFAQ